MLEVEVAVHKVEHKSHGMKEILDLRTGQFSAVTFLHIIHHSNNALPEEKLCTEISEMGDKTNPETSKQII